LNVLKREVKVSESPKKRRFKMLLEKSVKGCELKIIIVREEEIKI